MHQIQAMQAGKICFDLYFQPLITNSEEIDCWKGTRSEMLGLIFLFSSSPPLSISFQPHTWELTASDIKTMTTQKRFVLSLSFDIYVVMQ